MSQKLLHQNRLGDEPEWQKLIEQAQSGDSQAFGELCQRLRQFLLDTASHHLGHDLQSKLGASDIVQQSLLEVQRDIEKFCGSSETEFRAWVKQILKNNLIDVTRKYRNTQSRDTSLEVGFDTLNDSAQISYRQRTASSLIRQREVDEELMRAVASLPEKNRKIIELRHRERMSHAEIARAMGMTEVAARKLWSRTVEELRNMLTPNDDAKKPTKPR